MFQIGNYHITEKLFESTGTTIYRAVNRSDDNNDIPKNVILKHLKHNFPSPEQLARFRREFELTSRLGSKGVIQAYELIRFENSLIMVLEDIQGESLASLYKERPMRLPEFWRFAIKIVDCLSLIHSEKVIHKDINPSNILLNKKTQKIKLIDFGISIELASENVDAEKPGVLKGTLAYVSPEQTGRMNRILDYRTDFYSLGITFYQMLTGVLPFDANDPIEWVHAHIAKIPRSPNEINNRIPTPLSELVIKLISKNAEDRYVTVAGLRRDLEICRKEFSSVGNIGHFPLGSDDHSGDFALTQKIYGRDLEKASMLGLYDKVVNGKKALLTVTGVSGIGKTSLIREIQKPVVSRQGYYTEGKFDQFERSTPYTAILQSLTSLVRQLLSESPTQIDLWKERFLKALEGNGQLILDVIPELQHVIGEQEGLPNIQGTEVENRFHRTFQRFVRAVCQTERPLVIFLDDMQWCDLATLKLVYTLLQDNHISNLYLILAYRDNEVSDTHPFAQALSDIKQLNITYSGLKLNSLSAQDMTRFIADSMSLEIQSCRPLASLCYEKTLGNPFYFNQFLLSLHDAGQIRFSQERLQWTWDLANLRNVDSTDNVIDLMLKKMSSMPQSTQKLLQKAACIGNRFDLITLSTISQSGIQDVAKELMNTLKSGFLLPADEAYQWAQYIDLNGFDGDPRKIEIKPEYKFLHDRVQQAAYSSMSEEERKSLHLKIGRILLNELSGSEVNERIFEITGHFNLSSQQFKDNEERLNIANLNRLSGQKARASAAFSPAQDYFFQAIQFTKPSDWLKHTNQLSGIYIEAAEIAVMNARYDLMEDVLQILESNSDDVFVRVSAQKIRIQALVAQNRSKEAVNCGIESLKIFNMNIPREPDADDVQSIISETMLLLSGKSDSDLTDNSHQADMEGRVVVELLNDFSSAAFQSQPKLFALLVCKMVQLSVERGNTPTTPFAYATFGILLSGLIGDTEMANRYANIAYTLIDKLNAQDIEVRTKYVTKTFVEIWAKPLNESVLALRENFQLALTRGDFEYAAMSAMMEKVHCFYMGQNLSELAKSTASYLDMIKETGQEIIRYYVSMLAQTVQNLQTNPPEPYLLEGEFYRETLTKNIHVEACDSTALAKLYSLKLITAIFSGHYEKAQQFLNELYQVIPGVVASIYVPHCHFYESILQILHFENRKFGPDELRELAGNCQKFKVWKEKAPENFASKSLLLDAELARLTSPFSIHIIEKYEQSIQQARNNGSIHEEALGNELLARFWLQHKKQEIAKIYMKRAFHLYDIWGCEIRKHYLNNRFGQLLTIEDTIHTWEKTPTASASKSNFTLSQELDFSSVMKASQTISSEIVRENLLKTMMLLVLENAGAQNATLLLLNNASWQLTAKAELEDKSVQLIEEDFSFLTDERLPLQILQYVHRTREALSLQCAMEEPNYGQDPYVIKHQPHSVLCVPVIHRNEIVGLIYLENNLLKNAFTPDRVEIIQLLTSQLVISMDNASLYAELEARVNERTRKLHEANEKLTLLATTDSLTGASNRRHFIDKSNVELAKSRRSKRSVGVMMLDIDHFKKINDSYGHAAGDEALKKMVQVCLDTLRPGDIFGRIGGEEFAIVLPDIDVGQSLNVADRLRNIIAQIEINSPPHHFSFTVSIGVTEYKGTDATLEYLMQTADQGLYKAKRTGRNRVILAEE